MNIFITKFHGRAARFGVGSYIDILVKSLAGHKAYRIFVVHIGLSAPDMPAPKKARVEHVYIPPPGDIVTPDEYYISESHAREILDVMYSFVKKEEHNFFHLNSLFEVNIAKLAKQSLSCTVIYTMHVLLWQIFYRNDYVRFQSSWQQEEPEASKIALLLEKALCSYSDRVICISPSAKEFVCKEYGISGEKIEIIQHGIFTNPTLRRTVHRKRLLQDLLRLENKFTIIYSGRLVFGKGIDFLIEVLERVHQKGLDFQLILVGDDRQHDYYLKKCRMFKSKVSLLGFVSKKTLYKLYQASDIGVMVSLSEQIGYTILEMMSNSLPVLVSDNDSFSYLKCYEDSVIFIPMKSDSMIDLDSLERSIVELMVDEKRRIAIGRNAEKRVKEVFSIDKFTDAMLRVYTNQPQHNTLH